METQGRGTVLATKAAEAQGKGGVLPVLRVVRRPDKHLAACRGRCDDRPQRVPGQVHYAFLRPLQDLQQLPVATPEHTTNGSCEAARKL